jgi:outer membrane lipoprotein-sorting protein
MTTRRTLLLALLALLSSPALAFALTQAEVDAIIKGVDERQQNSGDYKSQVYIENKEKDKTDVVYDAVVYRRDESDSLIILFVAPKAEAGKGYLRIDKNLWFYDPRVGKWERRTERERIGGTGSNRQDFDESRLHEEYVATFVAEEKLGRFVANAIDLKAKPNVDVAYPKLKLWVDKATGNVLKRVEFAASGKAMRTSYYPKWKKAFSKSKGSDVWFPEEIRVFDEIEKGNRTVVLIRAVDFDPLQANIFTKAWLESKSR